MRNDWDQQPAGEGVRNSALYHQPLDSSLLS